MSKKKWNRLSKEDDPWDSMNTWLPGMSESRIKNGSSYHGHKGSSKVAEYRRRLLANMTKAERHIGNLLDELKIYHRPQEIFLCGKSWYIVDFYIPEERIVIECDGSSHDKKKEKDLKRTADLLSHVSKVIRLSNEECYTLTKAELKDSVQ